MTTERFHNTPLASGAIAALGASVTLAGEEPVSDLIRKIKSADDAVRGPAWQGAARFGAAAVRPLGGVMIDPDMETARAASRALWRIVRHVGRPGASAERKAVVAELVSLLSEGPSGVRREVVWMLSEIGDDEAVIPLAVLLSDRGLGEDARAALQRIPGGKSLAALKAALTEASADFKPALADALRARGELVSDFPSQKRVPTKATAVEPITAARE